MILCVVLYPSVLVACPFWLTKLTNKNANKRIGNWAGSSGGTAKIKDRRLQALAALAK
jgi:hypothetical protein